MQGQHLVSVPWELKVREAQSSTVLSTLLVPAEQRTANPQAAGVVSVRWGTWIFVYAGGFQAGMWDMGGCLGSSQCHDRDGPVLQKSPFVGSVPPIPAVIKHSTRIAPSCPVPTASAQLWESLHELVVQPWSFPLGLWSQESFQLARVTTTTVGKQVLTHHSRSAANRGFSQRPWCDTLLLAASPHLLWSRQREVSLRAPIFLVPMAKRSQGEKRRWFCGQVGARSG